MSYREVIPGSPRVFKNSGGGAQARGAPPPLPPPPIAEFRSRFQGQGYSAVPFAHRARCSRQSRFKLPAAHTVPVPMFFYRTAFFY
ncbi:hypothetical protein J6590_010858 [Homalodisca vitripennis]|nr:hypothetical protein J6590_010858 [Homalodisca vitripennis]